MGLFSKLFGGEEAATTSTTAFNRDAVREPVERLIAALDALTAEMKSDVLKLHNPGWQGRIKDLRGSSGSLSLLVRTPGFEKDDLFEVLSTVRPLYRGVPTQHVEHLHHLNQEVVDAIEDVHAASRVAV
ncbi:hypothetical protein [Tessaracoccus palaemonis]|uniref:Uncharacterized protein n=1 Tax=Tessaracoccus palaemonis TaxID=2829499 RepID=A0ABX8SKD6_9ACTN|nr:hypothetical protein [Tessaracoccus palaemonis]QXT63852.1 hypothetical protein KDB89_05140 [Tessaracoccus palaemonis]